MSTDQAPIDAPGWDAIDRAVGAHFPDQTPHQFTSTRAYDLASPSPLPAITVWECDDPPGWLLVTYGLSELFEKSSPDPERSGFGYELTLRTPRLDSEQFPPRWGLEFLQALGKHILETKADFDTGQLLGLGATMLPGVESELRGVACIPDPRLGKIATPHGSLLFLRLVGVTDGELEVLRELDIRDFVAAMAELAPSGITDPSRRDWAQDSQKSKILRRFRLGIRF